MDTPLDIAAALAALVAAHPGETQVYTLGRSHEGRPVLALQVGAAAPGRASVLVDGAHHGAELLSAELALDLAAQTLAGPAALRRELSLWFVPVVNPDGLWAFQRGLRRTGRKNGRDNNRNGRADAEDGVDLNRNYPFAWGMLGARASQADPASYWYRGPGPGSEPEVQALMALAEREHPVAALSLHTGSVALLAPYTIPGLVSPAPDEAWQVATEIGAGLVHPQRGALRVLRRIYPVDGTSQDWLRFRLGTVALLLESAPQRPAPSGERAAIAAFVRTLWQRLLARYLDGPSIEGVIRDAAGRPVEAEVELVDQARAQGERWTSRSRDGAYHRFLAAPGPVQVRVRAGRHTLERALTVRGRVRLDWTLPAAPR